MKNLKQPGNVVDVVESALTHPTHTDGLVDSGDAVVVGTIAGVAELSADASTDTIPVRVKGVVNVPVKGHDGTNDAAIAVGAKLYIGTAALINVDTSKAVFGKALAAVSSGATTSIDVLLAG